MTKKKLLITGASGLLGHYLLSQPNIFNQFHVFASYNTGQTPDYHNSLQWIKCDLTKKASVHLLIDQVSPDIIIHTAAQTQVDICELDKEKAIQINVKGTEYLLEAIRHRNIHFQYISTDFVFEGTKGMYQENDSCKPVNFYGETKLAAEEKVQTLASNWSIIRTVLVYGYSPHLSRGNLALWVIKKLKAKEPINVVNDQWRTPTFADDLAKGCLEVIQRNTKGVFHLSGPSPLYTPFDLALQIAKTFNLDHRLISPISSHALGEKGKRPEKTGLNISKAHKELGYTPQSFEEGLLKLSKTLSTM